MTACTKGGRRACRGLQSIATGKGSKPVAMDETKDASKPMKNNKAAAENRLVAEMLKAGADGNAGWIVYGIAVESYGNSSYLAKATAEGWRPAAPK